jgi:hypothetical protein
VLTIAVFATAAAVAACATPTIRQADPPPAVAPANVPSVIVLAPLSRVQATIIQRANQRGTAVSRVDARAVVLERELPSSPPVLEGSCGPHESGRRVRVILSTQEAGGRTSVTEERFVVDGARVCPVQLGEADMTEAMRSLAELKAQAETASARR